MQVEPFTELADQFMFFCNGSILTRSFPMFCKRKITKQQDNCMVFPTNMKFIQFVFFLLWKKFQNTKIFQASDKQRETTFSRH